jgi:hypothetical protein
MEQLVHYFCDLRKCSAHRWYGSLMSASSGMWRRVALVRTDVSEESVASIFMVE